VDLAKEMISIALGEPLSISSPTLRGHAIECRVYAEDARRAFAPSPGTITVLRLPQGPGVRNDIGVEPGSVVSIDYDPMLGKLIVHGRDRAESLVRLDRALAEYEIAGVETTLPLFRRLLELPDFRAGDFDVQWLDRRLADGLFEQTAAATEEEVRLAAMTMARSTFAPSTIRAGAAARESVSAWKEESRRESIR
jgi:acetyl-CoA carboxylase biotin carboxylase subunit